MKLEAIPFYGVGVALLFGVVYGLENYSGHTFEEPDLEQFCRPQVREGEFRWGRVAVRREPHEFSPGELVRYQIARTPRGETTSRVVATQGQRVLIKKGKVYVDGAEYADEYARGVLKKDWLPELIVPAGCVFVLNDQRGRGADRMDSRNFGPISVRCIVSAFSPKERIEGRGRR